MTRAVLTSDPVPSVQAPALSGIAVAIDASNSQIEKLVAEMEVLPQVEMPLDHRFAPGVYLREIFMPAGTFVIGHEHKTEHFNIVLQGRATVMIDGVKHEIAAPHTFVSGPGVRKVLYIHEDMRWQTVHANPDEERDIASLEERLLELNPDFLSRKGTLTVDEFRMSLTNQTKEITV